MRLRDLIFKVLLTEFFIKKFMDESSFLLGFWIGEVFFSFWFNF